MTLDGLVGYFNRYPSLFFSAPARGPRPVIATLRGMP